jgi:hypothetical protein
MAKLYGVLARFESPSEIYGAAEAVRDAGFVHWDVLSPFPIHGIDKAMGLKRSGVPAFSLIGGVIGFVTGMALAWYMGAFDYPLIVGGKPYFSPIFPFPIAYELTILLAAFGAFFGMFITNYLPMPYHPVMNYVRFPILTDNEFAIVIEARDPRYHRERTRSLLESLGAREVVELPE